MRNHLIWVEQPDMAGPIYLKPLTSEPAEEAVHNAIYANPEAMEQSAENEEPEVKISTEQVEVSESQEIAEPQEDEDDEDELSKELSAIQVPSDEQSRNPRIPIMELPPLKQPKTSPVVSPESVEDAQQ